MAAIRTEAVLAVRVRIFVPAVTSVTIAVIDINLLGNFDSSDFAAALKLYHMVKRGVLRKLNVMRRIFTEAPRRLLKKTISCICTSRRRM
jgi:hypothetical protein